MAKNYDFVESFRDQILRCSSCGFCQAQCPVFGLTLRPALNARGKMLVLKEVMDGNIPLDGELVETLFQCTTCANCSTHCPSGVNVPEIIKAVRRDMVASQTCHPVFEGMQKVLASHTNIYAEDDPDDFGRELDQKAENVFFVGCVGLYREDEATEPTLDLLDRLKVDYTLINEVCCTGVLEDVGYSIIPERAAQIIESVLATGAKRLITGCPYCYRTFTKKEAYKPLLDKGIEIVHISQFLKGFDFGVKTDKRITYHDPCDLGRHTGIYEEPRETIKKITDDFVELEHNRGEALCCGAGGGVRGAFPTNSIAMAKRRLEEVERSGADILLTECNSCLHNLANAKLRSQKFKIYTTPQYLMELLEEAD